jgi:hypothetical protein
MTSRVPETPRRAAASQWDSFQYTVKGAKLTSKPGTVTIVPPSGVLVSSSGR